MGEMVNLQTARKSSDHSDWVRQALTEASQRVAEQGGDPFACQERRAELAERLSSIVDITNWGE